MKQIMFSTKFPAYHPRKGKPTYFVEKIWSGLDPVELVKVEADLSSLNLNFTYHENKIPKVHTIRAGQRWKPGDQFVGKVWSGRPYRSKTIKVTPVLTVEKVWYVEITITPQYHRVRIDNKEMIFGNFIADHLAVNDGLSYEDFRGWFKKPFIGQIICWNKKVAY